LRTQVGVRVGALAAGDLRDQQLLGGAVLGHLRGDQRRCGLDHLAEAAKAFHVGIAAVLHGVQYQPHGVEQGGPRLLARRPGGQHLHEDRVVLRDKGHDHVLLRREIPEEGALRDIDHGHDLVDRSALIALGEEELQRRVDQRQPGPLLLALAQAGHRLGNPQGLGPYGHTSPPRQMAARLPSSQSVSYCHKLACLGTPLRA
jgi:hypothetical protein